MHTSFPSHSTSASATLSIHKRKVASKDHPQPFLPSSFSTDNHDGTLTANDDLKSISACGVGADFDRMMSPMSWWSTMRRTLTTTPPCEISRLRTSIIAVILL
ncbi:hypothetical protein ACFXTH_035859 [Malus domestica]